MKGIYLAAYKAYHKNYDLDYNDIKQTSEHINIIDDMLNIDLIQYDYIIATPPCNYYSKARGSKNPSLYAKNTKHLLIDILKKLTNQDKPFIVENVRNYRKFYELGLFNLNCFVYFIGRHTYWTNIMFNPKLIEQIYDYKYGGVKIVSNGQGGQNVYNVIECWLEVVKEYQKS